MEISGDLCYEGIYSTIASKPLLSGLSLYRANSVSVLSQYFILQHLSWVNFYSAPPSTVAQFIFVKLPWCLINQKQLTM